MNNLGLASKSIVFRTSIDAKLNRSLIFFSDPSFGI